LNKRRTAADTTVVIYGTHPVLETLVAGRRRIEEILLSKGPALPPSAESAIRDRGIPVRSLSPGDMLSLTATPHHQGLAARVGPFPYADLDDMLARRQKPRLILVLDEVQDPANLGNILRSAECLGAGGVVFPKDRSVPITAVVEKSSAGASAHIPIARVVNLIRAIEDLKGAGYWIYGTAADARDQVYSLDLTGLTAFVLGSEGKGMRRLVREHCDQMVSIPMQGKTASLNVSQMATILLAESLRQRISAAPKSGTAETQ
jgi:23S rRNA (guanosine2251-2'-O)-methyltransferase